MGLEGLSPSVTLEASLFPSVQLSRNNILASRFSPDSLCFTTLNTPLRRKHLSKEVNIDIARNVINLFLDQQR